MKRNTTPRSMMYMHHRIAALALTLVLAGLSSTLFGQSLTIYGINSSAFPKITADYVALDPAGQPITNLTAADFSIVETPQGGTPNDLTATLTHGCIDQNKDPEASIIIVLDRSQSMSDNVNGKERWEYAKDAVRAFVNRIKFVGETRVALVSFAGSYQVINDWVDNPQPILDSLKNLKWQTVTNYTLPFETPGWNIYEMFKRRPANVPKYTFFLTDGHPNPPIADEQKFVSENTQKLLAQGIRFFSVTIYEKYTHWTLDALAKATGGKSVVTDEKGIADLFSLLALETQTTKSCQISWTAPYSCTEQGQSRSATITLKRGGNPRVTQSYLAPPTSVARVDVSDPVLFCGDPAPNQSQFANVTITAVNAMFMCTANSIVPNTYFRVTDWNFPNNQTNFAPFNLAPGAKRVIRIQFTQGSNQAFRQAAFSLTGAPCPPNITLVGGTGLILLQSPLGGELYSTCDTVTIKWAGVLPSQAVSIDYSTDGGSSWNNITSTATGLSFKWLPPQAGVNYRIRVGVSPAPQYVWAQRLGGTGAETATSVAVQPNGAKVFVTGAFDGPTRIGSATSTNTAGNIDGYLAELDTDGNIVNTALLTGLSASDEERVIGCVTDRQGNYYVAGFVTSNSAQFGPYTVTGFGGLDTRNMFVFKFNANGTMAWQAVTKGSATQSSWANATDIGIRYDGAGNPELIVAGQFERYIEAGLNSGGTIERSGPYTNNTRRNYYIVYDVSGFPRLTANATPPTAGVTYKALRATDNLGFVYETDSYSGSKSFSPPSITLPNLGQTDVFVSKNGATPASADASKSNFSVQAPQLTSNPKTVTFPPTAQGQSTPRSIPGALKNTGSFPVTIQAINIVGANAADFSVTNQNIGTRLNPGDSLSLEVIFKPTGTGARSALLEAIGSCNATAQIILEGQGLAPCLWDNETNIQLGKQPLGQPKQQTVTCVLKNTGPLPLNGTMTVSSPDVSGDVTVRNAGPFSLAPGACLDVNLDIKAATPGMKTIGLAFGLPVDCGAPATSITIEIVQPRVTIDSVDFGRVRLLTPKNDVVTVANLNADPATITGFSLSAPDANFSITLPAPQVMPPGGTISIPVTYTPQSRGAHSVNIVATVQGQSEPLIGEVKGFGFQPVVEATGYTFNPWTVSATSPETGKVVVRNTDSESPLYVESVDFAAATASFAWGAPLPTLPATIPPGGILEFPVSFTPEIVGNNTIQVCVVHDGKPGPGPVPPYASTCVTVSGVGIDQSDLPPVVFPRTLTCSSRQQTVVVTNPSSQYTMNVQAPTITGDAAMFTSSRTAAFVIPPGGSENIVFTFDPSAVGNFSATYDYGNDQAQKLRITLSGEGIVTPVSFRFTNVVTGQPGQIVAAPVSVSYNTAEFADAQPADFTLTITHDPAAVRFNSFSAPQMAGWTFTPTLLNNGVSILAQSNGSPLLQGAFMAPAFDIYLNADTSLPISLAVSTSLSCLVPSGDNSAIGMKQVCFTTGRLVKFGSQNAALQQPRNNPVSDKLSVEYSTGMTLSTTFQIVDALGNVVHQSRTPVNPSGIYEFELDVAHLHSGSYFLRMISGPFIGSTSFMVVR